MKNKKIRERVVATLLASIILTGVFIFAPVQSAIDPNLKVYWKFDEASGTVAFDSSNNNNNGTLTNGPLYMTMIPPTVFANSHSLSFDGTNDFVVDSTLNPIISNDLTISLWLRTNLGKGATLVDLARSTVPGLQISISVEDGRLRMLAEGGPKSTISTRLSVADDKWHHAAIVRSGTAYKFYVDGVLIGTSSGILQTYYRLFVGARSSKSYFYKGLLDDIRIYNRALSGTDIQNLASGN